MEQNFLRQNLAISLRWFGWFVCGQALAASAISLHYLDSNSWPTEPLAITYLLLSRIGHFSLLSLLLSTVLILPPLLLWPQRRGPRIWATLCSTLLMTLLLADTFVYQQYRFHINGAVLDLLVNGGGQIISFSLRMQLMIALLVAVLALLATSVTWGVQRWHLRWRHGRPVAVLIFVSLLITNALSTWAAAVDYRPITRLSGELPLFFPLTANRLMLRLGIITPEQLQNRSVKLDTDASDFNYPLHPLQCQPAAKPLNLVVVLIDALRADMQTPEIMPTLSRLASQEWQFRQHVSASNGTRAGVFGLFYGIPPGYWQAALTHRRPAALISALQQQGYQIGVFTSAKLTKPEFNQTVFASVPDLRLESDGHGAAERDLDVTHDWKQWLAQQHAPFFSFLFFDAPHAYSTPKGYHKPFLPEWEEVNQMALGPNFDKTPYFNRYKNAAHFADDQLAQIEHQLKQQGLWDNTVVIISADHGEEFNDNGLNYWGHNGNFTATQTHVPLVVHWPGKGQGQHDGLTSHYDLTATLMPELLGCRNATADYSIGQNLFSLPDHDGVIMGSYTETALYQKDRITLIDNKGRLTVRDGRYRELEKNQLPRDKLMQMLDTLRHYNKR